MIWGLAAVAAIVVAGELIIWWLVNHYREQFKWLVTRADEAPVIPKDLIAKYDAGSFDADLGWVLKPDWQGVDSTVDGPNSSNIAFIAPFGRQ